ncbi:hypothetical protein [Streptomyces aureus]|uniref:Uncharacterized protein n=1 Tax=Streptomyces aureus TaxID=193461 RepID=A0ABV4SU86_9ACTN
MAAQAAVDAPKGIGSISSYVTEVALPAKGYNDDNVCSACR